MLPVRDVPVRADESGACCKIDQSLNESSGQQTLLRQKEASRGFLDELHPPHGVPWGEKTGCLSGQISKSTVYAECS